MAEVEGDSVSRGDAATHQAGSPKKTSTPPPEPPANTQLRSWVITSFWAVVILLGIPVWWWTTSIHRARLPLTEMLEWAEGKACKPTFPLQIAVEAAALQAAEASHLINLVQHALDDSNDFSAHHLRLHLAESINDLQRRNASTNLGEHGWESKFGDNLQAQSDSKNDDALLLRLVADEGATNPGAALRRHSNVLQISYASNQVPSVSSSSSSLASYIASELRDLFEEEQAIISYILTNSHQTVTSTGQSSQSLHSQSSATRDLRLRSSQTIRPDLANRLANRLTRSLKYSPTYHITISLFSPSANPASWEIQEAVAEYLTPLLEPISKLSNFSVDTQIQLHAELAPTVQSPTYDTEQGVWTLRAEDLSGFINAAEWPLSPSIGSGPTLNFVVYVPHPAQTPLVVKESHATSWLIPQWGGVYILNPLERSNETVVVPEELSKQMMQPALMVFAHQLLSLLGAPQHPQSLQLQLRTLNRIQAASLLLSASSTMGSLAELTKKLPTIAIPETVSSAVDTTLTHLRKTCDALREGNFNDALHYARTAETHAEKGFFEKSMVGQVYFPDEHKVAVYLPLLGPVGVPLVMSAVKELKRLLSAWKAKRART